MDKKRLVILILGLVLLLVGVGVGIYLVARPAGFSLRAGSGATPKNVRVSFTLAGREEVPTVSWTTEEAAQSLVYFGLNPATLTLVKAEEAPATSHNVTLEDASLPESTYYFTINVGKERFTNNGQPWQFNTSGRQVSPTPMVGAKKGGAMTLDDIKAAFGTDNPEFDLNEDGIVNAVDLRLFVVQEAKGTVTPTGKPTGTPTQ